jgi:hypothetical protein
MMRRSFCKPLLAWVKLFLARHQGAVARIVLDESRHQTRAYLTGALLVGSTFVVGGGNVLERPNFCGMKRGRARSAHTCNNHGSASANAVTAGRQAAGPLI